MRYGQSSFSVEGQRSHASLKQSQNYPLTNNLEFITWDSKCSNRSKPKIKVIPQLRLLSSLSLRVFIHFLLVDTACSFQNNILVAEECLLLLLPGVVWTLILTPCPLLLRICFERRLPTPKLHQADTIKKQRSLLGTLVVQASPSLALITK